MNVMASGAQTLQDTREVVSPFRVLAMLWRGRWLILAFGILAAVLAFAGARQLPRQYRADAAVAIETQRFLIPELQGAVGSESLPDPMPWVRTEAQVLRSRPLLRAVAAELNLEEDPDFNPALRPPSLLARVKSAIRSVLPAAPPGPEVETPTHQAVVEELNRHLGVTHDNRSLIIGLSLTARDPERAAAVLNSLIRHYQRAKAEARAATNRDANAALLERVDDVRADLDTLQQRVQQMRVRHNMVTLRAGSVGQQQLEDLAAALTRASTDRAQIEANWQRAVALARAGTLPTEFTDVVASQTVAQLRAQEAEAARKAADTANRFGPRHPDRRAAESELASVRAQIMAEARRVVAALESQLAAARDREADIARQLDEARQAAARASAVQAELQQLEREAEAQHALYRTLLERAEQTATDPQNAPQITGARVVSQAVPPTSPSSPRPLRAAAIGMVAGFALGGLLTLLRRSGTEPFTHPQEITDAVGLPVLGAVPKATGRGAPLPQRVVASPTGPEAEALRALRNRLRFAGRAGAAPRSLLFTSSVAGEGATSLAAAFARVAAADGLRTLLIAGDLQRPVLAPVFGHPGNEGLARALDGTEPWRDAVVRDAESPLDLLLADAPHSASHRLLEGMRMQNLLADAAEDYNLIVMEAPPVMVSSDAMPLAHRSDAVLLVIEAGRTPQETVRRAAERLTTAARNLAGTVLNKAR